MESYTIAVKRECRDKAPENWIDLIERMEAVDIIGSRTSRAIRVCGPTGTGETLAKIIGEYCHIEPVILHDKVNR